VPKAIDIAGRRFGRLLVDGLGQPDRHGARRWWCVCECGATRLVIGKALLGGHTLSCGCLNRDRNRERMTKHGMHRSPEYQAWRDMLERCENEEHDSFERYGRRGISVCERWHAFEVFFADMGRRRSTSHSIERKNNDGNYEPSNCEWALRFQQDRNKRSNHFVEAGGERLCVEDWAKRLGMHPTSILGRLKSGWSEERAVTEPPRRYS
jgi:hypothetical protein